MITTSRCLIYIDLVQCAMCPQECDFSQKGGVLSIIQCKCMHARAIHNAVAQGRTVQEDGSHPPNCPENHTLVSSQWRSFVWLDGSRVPGAKGGGA